jgi:hypothetical protein
MSQRATCTSTKSADVINRPLWDLNGLRGRLWCHTPKESATEMLRSPPPRTFGARKRIALLHLSAEINPIHAVGNQKIADCAICNVPLAALDGPDYRPIEVVLVCESFLRDAPGLPEVSQRLAKWLQVRRRSFSRRHVADFTESTVANATATKSTVPKHTAGE